MRICGIEQGGESMIAFAMAGQVPNGRTLGREGMFGQESSSQVFLLFILTLLFGPEIGGLAGHAHGKKKNSSRPSHIFSSLCCIARDYYETMDPWLPYLTLSTLRDRELYL